MQRMFLDLVPFRGRTVGTRITLAPNNDFTIVRTAR